MNAQSPSQLSLEELGHILMEHVKEYALLALDSDGLIVNWNIGAERLLGYRAADVVGKPFDVIFTPKMLIAMSRIASYATPENEAGPMTSAGTSAKTARHSGRAA